MSETQTSLNFRQNAARAVEDASLRAAMRNATDTFGMRRSGRLGGHPRFGGAARAGLWHPHEGAR